MSDHRRRRLWSVCLLVSLGVLVGLAGCSSTTGEDGPSGKAPIGEAGSNTTGSDESASIADLRQSHTKALADIETVTTEFRARLETEYGTVFFNSTAAIDLSAEAVRQQTTYEGHTADGFIETTFATVDSYATPAGRYKRTESDYANGTSYNYTSSGGSNAWDTESVRSYLQTDLIGSADKHIVWTREGTRQFNGTRTYRYVAEGASEFDGFQKNTTALVKYPAHGGAGRPGLVLHS